MVIMAVDDEFSALEALEEAAQKAAPEAEMHGFSSAQAALGFIRASHVDVAFLDIRMPSVDGLSLAVQLKAAQPKANIVFVTGYSQYMGEAFDIHASGYVTKPVNEAAIRRELENLRYPPQIASAQRVHIQCFGSFAVYVQGEPLHFARSKPKELLAYLVHKNGASITSAAVSALLWEDKQYNRSLRSQVQTVISQMMAVLKEAGIEDIVVRSWNNIALNKAKVHCDYFDFLLGKPQALNAYTGEYLVDYSWAEFMAVQLAKKT